MMEILKDRYLHVSAYGLPSNNFLHIEKAHRYVSVLHRVSSIALLIVSGVPKYKEYSASMMKRLRFLVGTLRLFSSSEQLEQIAFALVGIGTNWIELNNLFIGGQCLLQPP